MRGQSSSGKIRGGTMKLMYSASTAAVLVGLLGMGSVVEGQGTTLWNPVRTICNLRFGRGTIVENKLYVDGGEVMDRQNYLDGIDKPYRNSNVFRWQNEHLWEVDLSSKFNVSKPPWIAKQKPEDWEEHYNGAQGTLWNLGDGGFYTLGGWMSNIYVGPPQGHRIEEPYFEAVKNPNGETTYHYQLPPTRIHYYNKAADNWTAIDLPADINRLSDIGYTQSKRNKVGYTLGGLEVSAEQDSPNKGFVANLITGAWVNSMSAYDFKTNTFNTTELPEEIGSTNNVILHSLDRVGDEGILVALAGKSKISDEAYRPMDEIWIYDIASDSWVKQTASGDIPPYRTRTCSVLVPAPDLSSYQIYIFSGASEGDIRVLDMYVLSVPAFVWTKIELVGYPSEWPIGDTACALYEERQFMIIPGEVNVTTAANENHTWYHECNLGIGIHVFDTYDWEFKAEFDPEVKGSKVPETIVNLVGGNEDGGADLHQPRAGWDNKALGSIFSVRNRLPEDDDNGTQSTTTTTGTSKPTGDGINDGGETETPEVSDESKSNTAAIAGGVVGGIAGLALIAGAIFFLRRRRSPADPNVPELGANPHSGNHGVPPQPPYYDSPYTPNGPYAAPQELQAYEPQEMSGTQAGYYAPQKFDHVQTHPETSDLLDPPPSSLYPVSPEIQHELQSHPSGVDGNQSSNAEVSLVDGNTADAVQVPEPVVKAH